MQSNGRSGVLDLPATKQILAVNNVEVIYDQAISGLLPSEDGEITQGEIVYRGKRIEARDAAEIVRLGISQVMEGRRIFEHLTAEENLRAGAFSRRGNGSLRD